MRKPINDISPETIREILDYHPDTGRLFWKKCGIHPWRNGTETALTVSGHGYRVMQIRSRSYLAHRIAWVHYHGRWLLARTLWHRLRIFLEKWMRGTK